MNVATTIVDLAERVLPLDIARSAALPPVRAARMGAVAVARTVRHWELALGGDDEADVEDEGGPTTLQADDAADDAAGPADASSTEPDADELDGAEISGSELPVPGWAELSFADAQSALAGCEPDDLRTLLAYEQAHGHRVQFTLLLEHRLAGSEDAAS